MRFDGSGIQYADASDQPFQKVLSSFVLVLLADWEEPTWEDDPATGNAVRADNQAATQWFESAKVAGQQPSRFDLTASPAEAEDPTPAGTLQNAGAFANGMQSILHDAGLGAAAATPGNWAKVEPLLHHTRFLVSHASLRSFQSRHYSARRWEAAAPPRDWKALLWWLQQESGSLGELLGASQGAHAKHVTKSSRAALAPSAVLRSGTSHHCQIFQILEPCCLCEPILLPLLNYCES